MIESGSRAWGFASPDSDYDVRFIYVRNKKFYLSLRDNKDFIDWELNGVLDINGWDIKKALQHFNKSNALVHFYGNKNGENIYKCLKKEKFVAPPVQWTKETRMKKLIELIIKYVNTSKTSIPDSLPGFIFSNIVDDKKAMGNKLNKSYGGSGSQFNKMFKPFYKTLAKIKKK